MNQQELTAQLQQEVLSLCHEANRPRIEALFGNEEIAALQRHANVVSSRRAFLNDHGPVHMCKTAIYSMRIYRLLRDNGISPSLLNEEICTDDECEYVVILASYLHDIGMTIARDWHEYTGVFLAYPIIDSIIKQTFTASLYKQIAIRSTVIECIIGHMAHQRIHSIEAGILLVADGCDMEKGRAREPQRYQAKPKVGDIHQYSSASIESVHIEKGVSKPIAVRVDMSQSVGFFQIEEVLIPKIRHSTIAQHVEVVAGVVGRDYKQYL